MLPLIDGILLVERVAPRPTPDAIHGVAIHLASHDMVGIPRVRHEHDGGASLGVDESEHRRHREVGVVLDNGSGGNRSGSSNGSCSGSAMHDLAPQCAVVVLAALIATRCAVPIGEDDRLGHDDIALLDRGKFIDLVRTADVAHEGPSLGGRDANPNAMHRLLGTLRRHAVDELRVRHDTRVRGRGREVLCLRLNGASSHLGAVVVASVVAHGVGSLCVGSFGEAVSVEIVVQGAVLKRPLTLGEHRVVRIPLLTRRESFGVVAVHRIVCETLEGRRVAVGRNRIHVHKYRLNRALRPRGAASFAQNHRNLCKSLPDNDLERNIMRFGVFFACCEGLSARYFVKQTI